METPSFVRNLGVDPMYAKFGRGLSFEELSPRPKCAQKVAKFGPRPKCAKKVPVEGGKGGGKPPPHGLSNTLTEGRRILGRYWVEFGSILGRFFDAFWTSLGSES